MRIRKISYVIRSKRLLSALLFHSVLAGTEHYPILKIGFQTIVDIGANRGQFTLATKKWSPDTRVFAFEPLPAAANKFRRIFRKDVSVVLHEVAIGPRSGETSMHLSAKDDSSSLLPISRLQEIVFPGTREIGIVDVDINSLSNYIMEEDIAPPALLKIDVQGFELETLRGCQNLLNCFSHVYAECSFIELYTGQSLADEVIEWLRIRGFRVDAVYNVVFDQNGNSVQADFLFKNISPKL